MPVPKGKKPNVVRFAEVGRGELQHALQLAARDTTIRSDVEGKRTVWRDRDGNVIARHNVHKKSEQIVIAAHLFRALKDSSKPAKEENQDA